MSFELLQRNSLRKIKQHVRWYRYIQNLCYMISVCKTVLWLCVNETPKTRSGCSSSFFPTCWKTARTENKLYEVADCSFPLQLRTFEWSSWMTAQPSEKVFTLLIWQNGGRRFNRLLKDAPDWVENTPLLIHRLKRLLFLFPSRLRIRDGKKIINFHTKHTKNRSTFSTKTLLTHWSLFLIRGWVIL